SLAHDRPCRPRSAPACSGGARSARPGGPSQRRSGGDLHAAEAGGLYRHLRPRQRQVEALLDQGRLDPLTAPCQAFMQSVQAPEVVRMLTGPAELAIEAEIGPVNRFGLGDPSLLEQQRTEGVPRRLHPAPGLIVWQRVVEFDRPAQMAEGDLVIAAP